MNARCGLRHTFALASTGVPLENQLWLDAGRLRWGRCRAFNPLGAQVVNRQNPYEASGHCSQHHERQQQVAAIAFYGFSVLLLFVLVAVFLFNPSRHDPVFIFQTLIIVGGFLVWSTITARRLSFGSGIISAFSLVGLLTVTIGVGAALYGSFVPDGPIHPVLSALRTTCGIYILILWAVTIGAQYVRARHRSQRTR